VFRTSSIAAVAAVLMLPACSNPPGVFSLPVSEAYARLAKADIDGFRLARQCGVLIHFHAQPDEASHSVTWRVESSGQQALKFTIHLTETQAKTKASFEIPADPKGGEAYDGDYFVPRPVLHQPLRPALQELVDSAMEQRPYDVARIAGPPIDDGVCDVQRAGLEGGLHFSVDDDPGKDTEQTLADHDADAVKDPAPKFGEPMDPAEAN
jgi:hypothetical protein